jgi:hypothetical protein
MTLVGLYATKHHPWYDFNSEEFHLVLKNSPESASVLVSNCKLIYYDLKHQTIYAEEFLNKYYRNYYPIALLDSLSDAFRGYKKERISKSTFAYHANNCIGCIMKQDNSSPGMK